MNNNISQINNFVTDLVNDTPKNDKELSKSNRRFSKYNHCSLFKKDELISAYKNLSDNGLIEKNKQLEKVLRLKQIRSLSGIVVVSVLTKPYDCPGKCIYCPQEKNVPKSYLPDEPAVMRAITCNYDPFKQVSLRLKALKNIGHDTSKINIRIIGGTWSFYPKQYQTWFIKECFRACNKFSEPNKIKPAENTFTFLQQVNESSNHRIVEISTETRQDYINKKELLRLRKLGVTKVELGIQSIYDDVLKFNKRGHGTEIAINAIRQLKNAGFKVSYQIMLNLPGSNIHRDLSMIKEIFRDENYKPDYLKIYPLALVKEAPVYKLYKQGRFRPYSEDELKTLIKEAKTHVPYYCRIERVIRDIPSQYIVEGGSKISNLRQIITKELKEEGRSCRCIRCREIGVNFNISDKLVLFNEKYISSGSEEYFLSIESSDRKYLYSLLRLRLSNNAIFKFLKKTALVREIHTYGDQLAVSSINQSSAQHKGLGKKLLNEAEKIAKSQGYEKIAIIAGVGARNYFRKYGYELIDTYMVKKLQ